MTTTTTTTRATWTEAVWASPDLSPVEVLVALVYADHADQDGHGQVSTGRGLERSKVARAAWDGTTEALAAAGWLDLDGSRFALVVPGGVA